MTTTDFNATRDPRIEKYVDAIRTYSRDNYLNMVKEPAGKLAYPFIVPGSESYPNCLWDWDSWLTNIAVRQIMADNGTSSGTFFEYEKGCILNFLSNMEDDGRMPICVTPDQALYFEDGVNIHKPCLAQHAAFIARENADAAWLGPVFDKLVDFVNYYRKHFRHSPTGLYFWASDNAIGVDNDPCTFYRPQNSSASIYLNCLMYKELLSLVWLSEKLGSPEELIAEFSAEAENLKNAIRTLLWDERDGFFYSADIDLVPVDPDRWLHKGKPRHWNSIIRRIDVWSGVMALWAEIATPEQAVRAVRHFTDERTLWAPYGIRSLSKLEQMYSIDVSGNPSCWLGPVWGIANWMTFRALLNYGFDEKASELAKKTIIMFGEDLAENGQLSEYYHPETGKGLNNPGFLNWNLLVNNMAAWLDGRQFVTEF